MSHADLAARILRAITDQPARYDQSSWLEGVEVLRPTDTLSAGASTAAPRCASPASLPTSPATPSSRPASRSLTSPAVLLPLSVTWPVTNSG